MKAFTFELKKQRINIAVSDLASPLVTYVVAEKTWCLEEDYTYAGDGFHLLVVKGFKFDLASVPRLLWWLIAPFELSISAPLLHDFLYRYQGNPPLGGITPQKAFTRKEADRLFREIMEQERVKAWRRFFAYWGVRFFGGKVWRCKG
jgi:hypothetical protein